MTKPTADVARPGYRALLVPIDLTPASDRILARVARLPLASKARVTLLHVVPDSLPLPEQHRAKRDARTALGAEVFHLARAVPSDIKIVPAVSVGSVASEVDAYSERTAAEMIVMGRGGGRAVRDTFLGSTAERVIRRTRRPVLVARLPARAPYQRPALALNLDEAAPAAVAQLLKVIPAPRSRVTIIHAYDPPYQRLVYPSLSDDGAAEYLDHYRHEAAREIGELVAAALLDAKVSPNDAPTWLTHIQRGAPRSIIAKAIRRVDTDLLILGTHGHAGIAYVLLGTVAGDVLRTVNCDVLVVPPPSARRGRSSGC